MEIDPLLGGFMVHYMGQNSVEVSFGMEPISKIGTTLTQVVHRPDTLIKFFCWQNLDVVWARPNQMETSSFCFHFKETYITP